MRLFVTFGNKIIGRERNLSVLNYGGCSKGQGNLVSRAFSILFFKGKPGDEVEDKPF